MQKIKKIAGALLLSVVSVLAADEVTLVGMGQCAKCKLKLQDACQNSIRVGEGDKAKVYFLTGDVSKKFHRNLCTSFFPIKITGTHVNNDGRPEFEVTKIEKAQ